MEKKIIKALNDAGIKTKTYNNDIHIEDTPIALHMYDRNSTLISQLSIDYIYAQALNSVIRKEYKVALMSKEDQLRAVQRYYFTNKFGSVLKHFIDRYINGTYINENHMDELLSECLINNYGR